MTLPPDPEPPAAAPLQVAHVHECRDLYVVAGANLGDGLGRPAQCEPGDIYRLDPQTRPLRLVLARGADGSARVGPGSEVGAPGAEAQFSGRVVMMTADGEKVDLLVLEIGAQGYALPLSPVGPRIDYTLIEAEEAPLPARLADLACVAFTTGTLITLAGGAQRPIESLRPGERILTRDSGAQPLRLVARASVRALGTLAPVVIPAGVLGNTGDLVVSPHHRLFLYRNGPERIGRTSEILVQAKHLVDGETIVIRAGGYVDYYALVFDRHEIVYAEGIPCESLMVCEATMTAAPETIAAQVRARLPGLVHRPHYGTEAGRETLDAAARARLLASRGA